MDNGASFDTPGVPEGVQISDERNIFDFSLRAVYFVVVYHYFVNFWQNLASDDFFLYHLLRVILGEKISYFLKVLNFAKS